MNPYSDEGRPHSPKFRFSLMCLLIAFTGASLLCFLLVVIAPQVWDLVIELLAVRAFRKLVVSGLSLAAVFAAILMLALVFRHAILLAASIFESSVDSAPRETVGSREDLASD